MNTRWETDSLDGKIGLPDDDDVEAQKEEKEDGNEDIKDDIHSVEKCFECVLKMKVSINLM